MQFTFLGDNSPKPFSFDYLGDNTPPAAAPAPAPEEDDEDEEDALDDHEALDHVGDVGPEVLVDYSTFEDRDGSDGSTQEESEENPMRASARRESAALEFDDFLGGGGDYEEEPEANPMARHGGAPKKRGSAAFVDAAASYPEDGAVVLAENPMAAHRTAANYDAASLDDLDEPSLVGPTRRASEAPPARERARARATRSRTEPPVYAAGPPGRLLKPKKRRSSLKDDLLARQTTTATRRSSSLREDLLSGANPTHPRRRSSGADSAASGFDFDEHFGHDLIGCDEALLHAHETSVHGRSRRARTMATLRRGAREALRRARSEAPATFATTFDDDDDELELEAQYLERRAPVAAPRAREVVGPRLVEGVREALLDVRAARELRARREVAVLEARRGRELDEVLVAGERHRVADVDVELGHGVALERRALAPGHVVGAHPEAVARHAETDDAVQSAGRVLLEAPRAAAQRRPMSGGRGGGDPGRSPDHPAPHRPRHHGCSSTA